MTLSSLADPDLVAAIEGNAGALVRLLGGANGVDLYERSGFTQIVSGVPHPMLNLAVGSAGPEEVDEIAREAVSRVQERHVPMLWWVGLEGAPADLDERLEAHGVARTGSMPGMAAEIDSLAPPPTVPGLEIRRVTDPRTLKMFGGVVQEAFGLPESVVEAFLEAFLALGLESDGVQSYVGLLDGEPVGSATVTYGAGVAGLYNIGTVAEARGRGVGAAMTLAPLQEARAREYRVAILHSSQMGLPVYRRLGFQEQCTIGVYLWAPDGTGA